MIRGQGWRNGCESPLNATIRHTVTCFVVPGDALALYSDGITESANDKGEECGEPRLIEGLERHRELPAEALLASVVDQVRQFSSGDQHDDITLIIAKCR